MHPSYHGQFVSRLTEKPVRFGVGLNESRKELLLDAISFRVHSPKAGKPYGVTPHVLHPKEGIAPLHLGYYDMPALSLATDEKNHNLARPKPENHLTLESYAKGLKKAFEKLRNYRRAKRFLGIGKKEAEKIVEEAKANGGHDVTLIRFAIHDREHEQLNAREYWPYNPSEKELAEKRAELLSQIVEKMPPALEKEYNKGTAKVEFLKSKSGRETTLYALVKTKIG